MVTLSLLDIVLILILFFFFTIGFIFGFLQSVGSLVGLVSGIWAGNEYYKEVTNWISGFGLPNWLSGELLEVIIFIVIAVLVSKLIGYCFYGLDRALRLLRFIPFVKSVNRIFGALFSLIEGVLILGFLIHLVSDIPFPFGIDIAVSESRVATFLGTIGAFVAPLLPLIIEKVRSVI